ncbi:hypothetical protein P8452_10003 [Trifolium repens]|nr:hypothetical protein P8452_10003 [Trifolium repens]
MRSLKERTKNSCLTCEQESDACNLVQQLNQNLSSKEQETVPIDHFKPTTNSHHIPISLIIHIYSVLINYIHQEMGTEDFSFPRINDTFSYIIDSPPLWNQSSTSSSNNSYQHVLRDQKDFYEENLEDSKGQRKSFSSTQNGKKITREDDEEVPMDLLWEVFNEDVVEYRSLRIGNITNNALIQTKNKPSMLVMLKVLKKLFFINNSHGKPRRRIL